MVASSPQAAATHLIGIFRLSLCIGVAVELGVFDELHSAPRNYLELAATVGASAPHLLRLLRVLVAAEALDVDEDGRFRLTAIGEEFTEDRLGPLSRVVLGDVFQRTWFRLDHTIKTGEKAFDLVHGMPSWRYYASHPDQKALFDRAMCATTGGLATAIVGSYDFAKFGTIVDVGGGEGALLEAILAADPRSRGILFDLPEVVERARARLDTSSLRDRLEVIGGDFQRGVPGGGDAYIMKSILHNWPDESAIEIIRRVRATGSAATLLVIERVLPDLVRPQDLDFLLTDMLMMLNSGGRERTQSEFEELFNAGGYQLARGVPTGTPFSILEATPA